MYWSRIGQALADTNRLWRARSPDLFVFLGPGKGQETQSMLFAQGGSIVSPGSVQRRKLYLNKVLKDKEEKVMV